MAFTYFTTKVLGFLLSALAHLGSLQKGKEPIHLRCPRPIRQKPWFSTIYLSNTMMTSQGFRIYLGTNYHLDPHHHQPWITSIGVVKEISELHLETLSSVNSMDSKPTAFDSIFPVFHFLLRPLTASSSTASTVCLRRR